MTSAPSHDWSDLNPYFNRALELDSAERAEWLAGLAEREPGMARRIGELLALRERPDFAQFLADEPLRPDADDGVTLAGRQLGPYLIEAQIGRGGMGSVWRAHRTDGRYDNVVAVKFIHAAWIGGDGERRFRIEGNLLGRLDHPHIARLLDAGVLEGAQPYLVLEYVEGEPIDAFCEREQLDAQARVRLFIDVLEAVAHAHARLIVHRDIKPSNIFVTRSGSVKLLDFGIGKLLVADESEAAALTKSHVSALTPLYAAPEQLFGQPVSTASDVYSLGLVLYVLLTGAHPLGSAQRSTAELIDSIATEEAPLASSVGTIARIPRGTLQGDLDNILRKALKKEPEERYASAAAFADDLRHFLTHEPVRARADTLRYRTQKFVRRNRGGVAAGLLILTAIAAGFGGTLWQAHRANTNARLAERAREQAVDRLNSAEASSEFLSFLLEQGADKPFTTPQLLERGEDIVKRQFRSDPAMRGELLFMLADLHAASGESSKGETLFREAKAAAGETNNISLQARIDCSLALELAEKGDVEQSLAMLNTSVQRLASLPDPEPGSRASCLVERSEVDLVAGNVPAALADARAALAALGIPRTGQRSEALTIRMALADAELRTGQTAHAVDEYTRSIDELTSMGREQTQFAADALANLGLVLSKSGQWLRGTAAYERAITTERRVAAGNQTNPGTLINYAKLLNDVGRTSEALPLLDEAYSIAKREENSRAMAQADFLGAPTWCSMGKLDECAQRLHRAGELLHRQLHENNPMWGTFEVELAELDIARGQPDSARSHLHNALAIFQAGSDRNPNALRALALQAELELRAKDIGAANVDATALLSKARDFLDGFHESAWLGRALLVQGEVLAAQGNRDTARSTLTEAQTMLHETIGDAAPWTRQADAALAKL